MAATRILQNNTTFNKSLPSLGKRTALIKLPGPKFESFSTYPRQKVFPSSHSSQVAVSSSSVIANLASPLAHRIPVDVSSSIISTSRTYCCSSSFKNLQSREKSSYLSYVVTILKSVTRSTPQCRSKMLPGGNSTLPCKHPMLSRQYGVLSHKNVTPKRQYSTSNVPYSIQHEIIATNYEMWEERPYGIELNVAYIDTAFDKPLSDRSEMPTILALHDCPGSHDDFTPVVQKLADSGYRVVIPNQPHFGHTVCLDKGDDEFYTHTTNERAEFLVNFMNVIGVGSVDVLLGLGAGTIPAGFLASQSDQLKSLFYIRPWHCHKPMAKIKNAKWLNEFTDHWDYYRWRPILNLAYKNMIAKPNKIPISTRQTNAAVMNTMTHIEYNQLQSYAMTLELKQKPLVFTMCQNDPFMDEDDVIEFANLHGLFSRNFTKFDSDGNVVCEGAPRTYYSKGLSFDTGVFNPILDDNLRSVIVDEILQLADHVKSQ